LTAEIGENSVSIGGESVPGETMAVLDDSALRDLPTGLQSWEDPKWKYRPKKYCSMRDWLQTIPPKRKIDSDGSSFVGQAFPGRNW
jgi:hypothetical protein